MNKIKRIFPNIISNGQIGFVFRRSILDGVIIAQEVLHSIQKTRRQSMMIKLDIKKAYVWIGGFF